MEILSKQNEKIKQLIKLQSKKERKKQNLFVIETEKLINEAVLSGVEIVEIYYTQEPCQIECDRKFKITSALMSYVSSLQTSSNILAVCKFKENEVKSSNFLILENIQDPSNFGAIVRTAFGAGFLNIYTIDCVDAYEMKTLRSSMGSIFHVRIQEINYDDINLIEKDELICASMEGEKTRPQSLRIFQQARDLT